MTPLHNDTKLFANPDAPLLLRAIVISDVVMESNDRLNVRVMLATVAHESSVVVQHLTMPTAAGDLEWMEEPDATQRTRKMLDAAHDVVREISTGTLQYEIFGPQLREYGPPQPWSTLVLREVGKSALSALLTASGRPILRRIAEHTRNEEVARYIRFLESIKVTTVGEA